MSEPLGEPKGKGSLFFPREIPDPAAKKGGITPWGALAKATQKAPLARRERNTKVWGGGKEKKSMGGLSDLHP